MVNLRNMIIPLLVVSAAGTICSADEWEAPAGADTLVNPIVYDSAAAAQAQTLYQKNCAACHGITGGGDGMMAKGMRPPPENFTEEEEIAAQSDGALFWKIKTGKKPMPKWGKELSDAQIWSLVRVVRGFSQPEAALDSVKIEKSDSTGR